LTLGASQIGTDIVRIEMWPCWPKTKANPVSETLDMLSMVLHSLNIKMQCAEHKINQSEAKAKQLAAKGRAESAAIELANKLDWKRRLVQYEKLVQKAKRVRDAIIDQAISEEVLAAFAKGNVTLKQALENVDIDDIDKLMDELADNTTMVQDISQALARPIEEEEEEEEIEDVPSLSTVEYKAPIRTAILE
jgi:hypothetical protein